MAQYADNQEHSHTCHAPVATDAEYFDNDAAETSLGPVTSFSGMPDFPAEVIWPDLSTTEAEYGSNATMQTAPAPVTSFSGMPNFPTEVTWPGMPETTIQYTGQPNSRGRHPRWRPHIETPNAYSASFNPETEENNCFFGTAGSIVGLSSVGFCDFIGYKRDHDVGVTAEGQY